MPPVRPPLLLFLLLLLFGAAPAAALTIDPSASSVTPDVGAPSSLSGTIEVAIGELPLTGTTTFDVLSLSVFGGAFSVTLDPASPTPGLGVVNASGAFLVPNLFLAVDTGGAVPFPLSIPGVSGTVTTSGTGITSLTTSFAIDSGGPEGVLQFVVVAVPEPTWLTLLLLPVIAGCSRGGRRS